MKSLRYLGILVLLACLAVSSASAAVTSTASWHDVRAVEHNGGILPLDGTWDFYWQQLLEPEDFLTGQPTLTSAVQLPGAWNGHKLEEQNLPGQGYATYRVQLLVPDGTDAAQVFGLRIPRILTSYRLWVNGQKIASAGQVGTTPAATIPQYRPQQAFFQLETGSADIILQVANFHHRSGGVLESLYFGTAQAVTATANRALAYDLFLFGALLIMGLYHLALFLFRPTESSLLYFGIFCLLVGLRTVLVGEIFFTALFPDCNWEWAHKVQTLSFYLGALVILMFFHSILPGALSLRVIQMSSAIIGCFSLLVLLTPARTFTVFNPLFQLFTVCLGLYLTHQILQACRRRVLGAPFIAIGFTVLFLTVVNDLVFYSVFRSDLHILRPLLLTGSLSSFGLLLFTLMHSLVLGIRFARTLSENEQLANELVELNENLEATVAERTADLAASKTHIEQQNRELERANNSLAVLSLKDPLTNLWNRRYFNESLEREWGRAQRHGQPLSLLFIDIDHFKKLNDEYGHEAGDQCLRKVGQLMQGSAKRAEDMAARYGGEEFVVLLPNTDSSGAYEVAESLRSAVANHEVLPHPEGQKNDFTCSIGVASTIPTPTLSPADLLTAADAAMYEAKRNGRNRVAILDPIPADESG